MSQETASEQPVIRCYNKPGIATDLQARLTAEGLFVADFETGWSLNSEHAPDENRRPAAGRTFNRITTIATQGGLGVIRTPNDDDQIITVGEWRPNCATFREIDGTKLKGIQMARYGLVVPSDQHYGDLDAVFDPGGQTVNDIPNQKDLITDAITHLKQRGRLRSPTH